MKKINNITKSMSQKSSVAFDLEPKANVSLGECVMLVSVSSVLTSWWWPAGRI